MSREDESWIEASLKAWKTVGTDILEFEKLSNPSAVIFDSSCVFFAPKLEFDVAGAGMISSRHSGEVPLPTGEVMPAVVTSFSAPLGDDGSVFFVMSTPSVWRAGGVESGLDLPTFMTSVLIHEISHTSQFATYLRQVTEIEEAGDFGDDLTDDILQDTFEGDPQFAAAIEAEIDLLFRAAASETKEEARRLALEATASIEARRSAYQRGEHSNLLRLEDLFLTVEGAAQWAGYSWLISSGGASLDESTAMKEFGRRSRFWSQNQGLALFLVLDRFSEDWKKAVYGDGSRTVLELLDQALGE